MAHPAGLPYYCRRSRVSAANPDNDKLVYCSPSAFCTASLVWMKSWCST
jgi:hypothetical protein